MELSEPPHKEVGKEFLYRAAHGGRHFVTLDLRTPDFTILHIAAPEEAGHAETWESYVRQEVPEAFARSPCLPELKPLRIRVLGKAQYGKNALLQTHVLRLLTRVVVTAAAALTTKFEHVSDVFRLSRSFSSALYCLSRSFSSALCCLSHLFSTALCCLLRSFSVCVLLLVSLIFNFCDLLLVALIFACVVLLVELIFFCALCLSRSFSSALCCLSHSFSSAISSLSRSISSAL
jgi:hypothetical protein